MGHRWPVKDGVRGGNNKFDVYLKDVGANGLFGDRAPERTTAASKWVASGYCVLDDDFARSQFAQQPILSLKATAAHEFFHAIQFAYDYAEEGWFMEATSTWMEERVFDGVNDNRRYLRFGQLGVPGRPLDVFQNAGGAQYGNWGFFEYLSGHFGTQIVRTAWRQAAAVGRQSRPLLHRGGQGGRGRWGSHECSGSTPRPTQPSSSTPRTNMAACAGRPGSLPHRIRRPDLASGSLAVDHLASRNVSVEPHAGLEDPGWQRQVSVDDRAAVTQPVRASSPHG